MPIIKLLIIHSAALGWPVFLLFILSKLWQDPRCWNFKTQFWNSQERGQRRAKGTASDSLLLPRKSFPWVLPLSTADFPSCWALHLRAINANQHRFSTDNQNAHIMKSLPSLTLLLSERPEHALSSDHRSRFTLVQPGKEEVSHKPEWSYTENSLRKQPGSFRADQLPKAWWSLLPCLRERRLPVRRG